MLKQNSRNCTPKLVNLRFGWSLPASKMRWKLHPSPISPKVQRCNLFILFPLLMLLRQLPNPFPTTLLLGLTHNSMGNPKLPQTFPIRTKVEDHFVFSEVASEAELHKHIEGITSVDIRGYPNQPPRPSVTLSSHVVHMTLIRESLPSLALLLLLLPLK